MSDEALDRDAAERHASEEAVRAANRQSLQDNHSIFEIARLMREHEERLAEQLAGTLTASLKDALTAVVTDKKVVEAFFATGFEVIKAQAETKTGRFVLTFGWGALRSRWVWSLAATGAFYFVASERAIHAIGTALHEFFKGPP